MTEIGTILYEVQTTFRDADTARRWVAWLHAEHIAEVISCGAANGRLVRLDEPAMTYVVQYEFTSRAAFDAYLRDHAPRLRVEGLKRFPATEVTCARRSGEIMPPATTPRGA